MGGGEDAAAGYDPNAQVSITWWTGQTADAHEVLEKLAAEYHGKHPNVTIKASPGAPTTDDLLTKLSAGFTGGTYPDISYAYGSCLRRPRCRRRPPPGRRRAPARPRRRQALPGLRT
jgi:ABC-type glycerol-3-phosphate transport system substrate-binding protein